ncbi:helix-turn-helix domain-containing protein [Streptomyces sp. NPDC057686]|uniref:helix-turn-helix domain-containing protein n=1 Tax=Streptomyces sp. NPDC057686 TaxID=3346212 RepID=UPI0036B42C7F
MLSDEERAALEGWVRRRSTPQAWALRCRIILACAEGVSNKDVAVRLGSTPHAVGRWRARFVEYRIAGLGDMPRSGGPRSVTDEQVAAVVTRTLESTPKNATHWSTRSMAKEMGLSQSSVSRIWRAFGLQPHRSETFKLPPQPFPAPASSPLSSAPFPSPPLLLLPLSSRISSNPLPPSPASLSLPPPSYKSS